ncbi:MAG: hypothetical protein Q7T56_17005 [Nocardioidaceae bacterium]|nr:hypothetical protein [Nocardioidaceae bacterium]
MDLTDRRRRAARVRLAELIAVRRTQRDRDEARARAEAGRTR